MFDGCPAKIITKNEVLKNDDNNIKQSGFFHIFEFCIIIFIVIISIFLASIRRNKIQKNKEIFDEYFNF